MSDLLSHTPPPGYGDPPAPRALPSSLQHAQDNAPGAAGLYHEEPNLNLAQPVPIAGAPAISEYWSDQNAEQIRREYQDMKEAAASFWPADPVKQKEEAERVQLSFYVGKQLQVPPVDVYKAWTSKGANPYAEQYFGATDLPQSWAGNMRDELVRSVQTYKATNMFAAMAVQPYNEERVQAGWDLLKSIPAPRHMVDRGWLWNTLRGLPQLGAQQLPMLADMGVTGLITGGLAAAAVGWIAPEAAPAAFVMGRRVGAYLAGTKMGTGQIMMDVLYAPSDPSNPDSPPAFQAVPDKEQLYELARKVALTGGVVTGAAMAFGAESVMGGLSRAGTKGVFSSFAGQMILKYGKNVGVQTSMMDLQGLVNDIAKNSAFTQANQAQGTGLPVKTANQIAADAIAALPTAFESSVLIAIPGSMAEAKTSLHAIFERENKQKGQERALNIERITDPARPPAERAVDIEARLQELRAAQAVLQPKIDAIPEGKTLDEKVVREHQSNQAEIQWLQWNKEETAKAAAAADPNLPWHYMPKEWEAREAQGEARATALPAWPENAPADEVAAHAQPAQGTVTGEVSPYLRRLFGMKQEHGIDFKTLTLDQMTPEIERRIKDSFFKDAEGRRIPTAEELNAYPHLALSGGMAGAGKDEVVKGTGVVTENRVLANLDLLEEMTGHTEKPWHEWARRMADEIAQEAMDKGYHLTLDSPLTYYDKADALIQKYLEKKGEAVVAFSHIDTETSRARNRVRALLAQERGETVRDVDIEGTVKGWNQSLPTFIELYKKYKDDPRVRFSLWDNRADNAAPKVIMRNNAILDQKALDEILATEYIKGRGEKGETFYTRTAATAATAAGLASREHAALERGDRLRLRRRESLPHGPSERRPLPGQQDLPQLTASDLSPTSPTVALIREGLPNLNIPQAQGAALLAKLYATHVGQSLDSWVRARFAKGIFSTERQAFLESINKKGGIDWNAEGKAIFYTTTRSDFATWVHELTHAFTWDLTDTERTTVNTWLKAGPVWTRQNHEDFANSSLAYIAKGNVPTEELRPVFERFARWVNDVYESAKVEWVISPDIVKMYDQALSDTPRAPKDHTPDDIGIMFETGPREKEKSPEDLSPSDLLLQTDFSRAWRSNYFGPNGEKKPGSSLTTPAEPMNLRVGQWMIDDHYKGIHGREIAVLRELDPATLDLPEGDYTTQPNYQGRGDDARRYAEWMKEGKTPPPITVVETDAGNLRVVDGHRRTAAAKMTSQKVLAWVYPAMDHPEGLRVVGGGEGTGNVMRVGLTYEGATGRVWEQDQAAAMGMLYETSPEQRKRNSNKMVKIFGETSNPAAAGYIAPDGRMLNFNRTSMTGFAAEGGLRDHSDIPFERFGMDEYDTPEAFVAHTGAIRVDIPHGSVEDKQGPSIQVPAYISPEQRATIESDFLPRGRNGVEVEVIGKKGTTWAFRKIRTMAQLDALLAYANAHKGEDLMLYETAPGDKEPWILKSRAIIMEKMKGPQPASNVLKMLTAGGVKEEELYWLGLDTYLKGNKKLRPEEVLQYIADHHIDITEQLKADFPTERLEAEKEKIREQWIQEEMRVLEEKQYERLDMQIPSYDIESITDTGIEGGQAYELTINGEKYDTFATEAQAQKVADRIQEDAQNSLNTDLWNQAAVKVDRDLGRAGYQRQLEEYAKEALMDQGLSETQFSQYVVKPKGENYSELIMKLPERQKAGMNYDRSHWGIPNALLHIRFDDRTDAEGKRSLHVEEIQSDWHEMGRKEGYQKEPQEPSLGPDFTVRRITADDVSTYDMGKVGEWGLFDPDDELMGRAPATHTEQQARIEFARDAEAVGVNPEDFGGTKGGIPDAPFKKTWPELGFKRAVRWAAENGYDQVTWSTGEQNAEHYDLAKQVDAIEITKRKDGSFTWNAIKDKRSVVIETAKDAKELEGQIGKDLAKKADEQPPGLQYYTGVDLKVGDQGMKAFYDQQLVFIAKKIAKKYGAKVDMVNVGAEGPAVTEGAIKDALNDVIDATDSGLMGRLPDAAARILGAMKEGDTYDEALIKERMHGEPGVADEIDARPEIIEARTSVQAARDLPIREALRRLSANEHVIERVRKVAAGMLDTMEKDGFSWDDTVQGTLESSVNDRTLKEDVAFIEASDEVAAAVKGSQAAGELLVHRLELPQALKDDVMTGQMLFGGGPHEESVRQAVEKGLPVPDNVLQGYHDREWAAAEIQKRALLQEAARSSSSYTEFFDWQTRAHPDVFPNDAYYRQIWDATRASDTPASTMEKRFSDAMDEDTVRYIVGGFALASSEVDPQAKKNLTPEMIELGRKVVGSEEYSPELMAKVREQLAGEPTKWRVFFKDYMPTELLQELQASIDAGEISDFVPVLPKVANERFTDRLQDPKEMEAFLLTVGSAGFEGKNKWLARMAERLERQSDFRLDPLRARQALREVRRNITTHREAYAVATMDEGMLRQLDAELEKASVTEEGRLLTENQRLRREVTQSARAVHETALREAWTAADLTKERKATAELTARYEKDIAEAKAHLRDSVEKLRTQLTGTAAHKRIIDTQLWKRHMNDIKKRNEKDLAVLKARVNQVREQGRLALRQERDSQRIQKYAEFINRPVNASIADTEARMIEDIQHRILHDPDEVTQGTLNRLREWRRQNPQAPMPSDLVQQIEARDPRTMTAGEMRQLYDQVKGLRRAGRQRRLQQLLNERVYVEERIKEVGKAIQGSKAPKEIKGLGTLTARREMQTPFLKQALWATWRMNRLAEMMDGGKPGPVTEWLNTRVNDATDEVIRRLDTYATENVKQLAEMKLTARDFGKRETIDDIEFTHGQMVGVYIYAQFDDGLFSLRNDNRIHYPTIQRVIQALGPEEKRYGDWMIEHLSSDTDFDRLQQVQLDVMNIRMDRVPRYFPFQRQGPGGSPMLSDLARELLDMAGKTKNARAPHGFTRTRMERIEGVSFPPLKLDAPAIYMDHIAKREFYIANALLIKRLTRIFDSRDVKATMTDRYGMALQPLVQKYITQYTNPNIYRAFEDYGEFARVLRSNVGMSLIGSNLMTILKQLPDIPQIMIMAGPIDGLHAAAEFAANPRKAIQRMWEKAPQLRSNARSYDRFIEELKLLDRNAYERTVRTVGEAGFAVLKAMDTVTNTIGWTAIYNRTMRQTGNDNVASAAARDFILRKRPAARAKDLAAIYRSPGLGWFLMFTNQQNQQWNILTYDVPHAIGRALRGDPSALISATLDVTGLLVGALAMGLVVRKGATSAQGTAQDLLNVLFGNTPFIGNAIEAAIRGQPPHNPLDPFRGAYEAGKLMRDVASQAETAKVMRDLHNLLFTAAGTLGFPVIQAKRIYKTIDTGDPWELIGGPPKGEQ